MDKGRTTGSVERPEIGWPGTVHFGEFELDPLNRELRQNGARLRLQNQPFQVLSILVEHAGNVVARDELRARVWPSSVFVDFDHGLNNAITRVREVLGDSAAAPRFIETLPRHGYRFIHPLGEASVRRVASASAGSDARGAIVDDAKYRAPPDEGPREAAALESLEPDSAGRRRAWSRRRQAATALAGMAILVLVAAWWFARADPDRTAQIPDVASPPAIAVLPFTSVGRGPDDEQFADGLTSELLNRLAAIRGLRVTGRTSSFYYKGKQESLSHIARALKVDHVLEGSVQRSGTRLRISAQLVEARNGTQIWSQIYDRDLTDIFRIQEDVAFAVTTALRVTLLDDEKSRLRKHGTTDAEAYRLYTIGMAHLLGITARVDPLRAKQLLDQAVRREPGYAAAWAGLARYHFVRAFTNLVDVDENSRLGQAAAARAVELDPESSEALLARANFGMWRYRFLGDYQASLEARADYRRAIQVDPGNELLLFDYGRAVLWLEPELAHDMLGQAVAVEPLMDIAMRLMAQSLNILGRPEQALQLWRVADERKVAPVSQVAPSLAAIAEQQGRIAEAAHRMEAFVRDLRQPVGLEFVLYSWSLELSSGEEQAALRALGAGDTALSTVLQQAARLSMQRRYVDAFELLDRSVVDFDGSRILDVPAARFALIAGRPSRAVNLLERRIPDVVSDVEPINSRNVMPALDLALAYQRTGRAAEARTLLGRVATFLDGFEAPRLGMFIYLRARTHALAGERALALQALERAFASGFRTLWAVDLHPQPFMYLDPVAADPAFDSLRRSGEFQRWLGRIEVDVASQVARRDGATRASPSSAVGR